MRGGQFITLPAIVTEAGKLLEAYHQVIPDPEFRIPEQLPTF
jgi:hypothetical protein